MVTVWAAASAAMSFKAPEVLPLIWIKPVLVLPEAVVSDGVVASLMVTAPERVFAPVEVMKVPVLPAKVLEPEPEAVKPPVITGVVSAQEVVVLAPVKVLAASVRAMVAEVDGKVMVVLSVPAKVRVLLAERVLPLVKVKVPVEEVIVKPLTVVAVATPKVGVTNVGEVANTRLPVPVTVGMPVYCALQEAVVVPEVRITVKVAWELPTIARMLLAPED